MDDFKSRFAIGRTAIQSPKDSLRILVGIIIFLIVGISLTSLYPLLRIIGTSLLGLIALFQLLSSPNKSFQPASLHVLILILLVFEGISLIWTPYPHAAAEQLIFHLFLYILFLTVQASLFNGWKTRNVHDALILLGLVFVIFDVLLFSSWYRGWLEISTNPFPPVGYRSSGHLLGHPNSLAGFLSLLMPIVLAKAFNSNRSSDRWFYAGAMIIIGIGLFLTSSRGGWLASVAGLVLTGGVLISTLVRWPKILKIRSSTTGISLRGVTIWILIASTLLALVILGLWQVSNTPHASPIDSRLPVWKASVEIGQKAPILGNGLRSYPTLFAELPSMHRTEDVPHAHNVFLQIWVELGVFGVLILTTLILLIGFKLFISYRRSNSTDRRELAKFIGIFAVVFVHQQFDHLLGSPFYAGAILILLATFLHSFESSSLLSQKKQRVNFGASLLIIIGILSLILLQQDNWRHWKGVIAAYQGNWESAANILCSNSRIYPNSVVTAANCRIANSVSNKLRTSGQGIDGSEHVLDPNWHVHWQNQSASLAKSQQFGDAAMSQMRASELAPQFAGNHLQLAYFLELSGQIDQAKNSYREAIILSPEVIDSHVIQSSAIASSIAKELSVHFRESPPNEYWLSEDLIWAGKYEAAIEVLNELPESRQGGYRGGYQYYVLLAESQIGLGNLNAAEEALAIHDFIRPATAESIWARHQLARSAGDDEEARRIFFELLEHILISTSSSRYYFTGFSRTTIQVDQQPGVIQPELTTEIVEEALRILPVTDDRIELMLIHWALESAGYKGASPANNENGSPGIAP